MRTLLVHHAHSPVSISLCKSSSNAHVMACPSFEMMWFVLRFSSFFMAIVLPLNFPWHFARYRVEKETVFTTLSRFPGFFRAYECLLMTAKGKAIMLSESLRTAQNYLKRFKKSYLSQYHYSSHVYLYIRLSLNLVLRIPRHCYSWSTEWNPAYEF